MKFCTHCGSQLDDNAVFCPHCGCPTELYGSGNNGAPKPRVYSPLSIVGFVFAFLIPLVGLICSVLAFKNAQADGNERCKTFAKAGIIISAVFLGIEIIADIVFGVLVALDVPINFYWSKWSFLF